MPPRYHVFLDGEVTAPFPESVIISMLNSGTLNEESLLCREGEDDWEKAKRVVGWEQRVPYAPHRPLAQLYPPLEPRPEPRVIYVERQPEPPKRKSIAGPGCLVIICLLILFVVAGSFMGGKDHYSGNGYTGERRVTKTTVQNGNHSIAAENADSWLSGGTLHRATLREWIQASHNNRLATAGDWLAAARPGHYSNTSALKADAYKLVADVNTGASKPELRDTSAADFAAGVLVLWGDR